MSKAKISVKYDIFNDKIIGVYRRVYDVVGIFFIE
jgi:hypothetical protein